MTSNVKMIDLISRARHALATNQPNLAVLYMRAALQSKEAIK